jgi:hypothetical protein
MKRLLTVGLTAAATFAALTSTALASPTPAPPTILDGQKYCPLGPLVVNVTQNVIGDVDRGADGHVWALDNYSRLLQVTQVGPNLYCAGTRYTGTFLSLGGRSPQGGSYVSPGVVGTIGGGFKATVFSAKFRPQAPTTGTTTYFYGCDLSGNCPGYVDWVSQYFTDVSGYGWDRWQFIYYTSLNGYWNNSWLFNSGDVSG